jgi:hypothetical protein
MATMQEMKREFTNAIKNKTAAIFAGAGLSCSCGFVNWKDLLRDLANDIRLDVDREDDLVSVAQYYCNEKAGRGQINQKLMRCFTKYVEDNENISIIAHLPINTYWTTNYDSLIEDGLRKSGKRVDVKSENENFAVEIENIDATVYKMHGDISSPFTAVLTKDDYESYDKTRRIFSTALQGDLVTKTFLFIGCSMTDPNMKYILSRIRVLLHGNQRTHYCLLKAISKSDFTESSVTGKSVFRRSEYEYAKIKRELEIKDLRRYGIDVVEYEKHDDVFKVLKEIEDCYRLNNIYLSGSAAEYGDNWNETGLSLLKAFVSKCFTDGYKITTGYGDGVGSFVISTILEKVLDSHDNIDKYLCLRPFPYEDSKRSDYDQIKYKYRQSMIEPTGVGIFVFGNKITNNQLALADGVIEEFRICKSFGKLIIPLGSTGFAAEYILNEVKDDITNYSYLMPYLQTLSKELNPEKLIQTVFKIINDYRNKMIKS